MNEEPGPQEDISALWGPQGNGILDPAPMRAGRRANGHNHDDDDRVTTLERELRQVTADLTQRLDRLERQVASLTESRRASLARLSKALKGH